MPAFPYLRGNVNGAVDLTIDANTYNYANTMLLHFVTNCFAGWRGSMRWNMLPHGFVDPFRTGIYVSRSQAEIPDQKFARVTAGDIFPTNASEGAHRSVVNFPYDAVDVANRTAPPTGAMGMAFTHGNVNPVMEAEIPFYSSYRFIPGKIQDYTSQNNVITGPSFDYRIFSTGRATGTFDLACAAGDDFQVYFWTGQPRMYYEPRNPLPAP